MPTAHLPVQVSVSANHLHLRQLYLPEPFPYRAAPLLLPLQQAGHISYTYSLNNGSFQSSNVFCNCRYRHSQHPGQRQQGVAWLQNRHHLFNGHFTAHHYANTGTAIACNGGTSTVTVSASGGGAIYRNRYVYG